MNQSRKLVILGIGCLIACCDLYAQGAAPLPLGKATLAPRNAPTFRVDVDLVLVDVGVHDEKGRAVGNLTQADFHVFEDGREQQILAFSHEELPLAVALVVDNSSSIVAALDELRAGALDTLALLKPEDQVAIFSFGERPEMEEGLTTDHQALSVDLWALSPYGGTDIDGALFDAATYLGHTAPQSRRAVILVSDNEPSEDQSSNVEQVVRAAQQSGTPIYSIKVGYLQHSRSFFLTHPESRLKDVEKICFQTGGEMIDTRNGISVSSAMETILTWLKQGYTLGYYPSNKRHDGSYRRIEVRLDNGTQAHGRKYRIYARAGYYAPVGN